MRTINLRKVGGSVRLAVPPLPDILRLQPGARVGIAVQNGRLVVEPQRRPRYALNELLAKCNARTPRNSQERDWLKSKPAGGELISWIADCEARRNLAGWSLIPEGHEPPGRRPVLIVSPEPFNRVTKVPLLLPITSGGDFREDGWLCRTADGRGN